MQELQYIYDVDKNRRLKEERGVNFEDVIIAIEQGHLLNIKAHHNPNKYSTQDILIVEINRYVYLVPCLQEGKQIVLKTVYPSRKATAHYLTQQEL